MSSAAAFMPRSAMSSAAYQAKTDALHPFPVLGIRKVASGTHLDEVLAADEA